MFPRLSLLLLICCWWQCGSLLFLAPKVALADEDNHQGDNQDQNYNGDETRHHQESYNEDNYENDHVKSDNHPKEQHETYHQQEEQQPEVNQDNYNQEERYDNTPEHQNDNQQEDQYDNQYESHAADEQAEEQFEESQAAPEEELDVVYEDYQQSDDNEEPGVDWSWPMHAFGNRHPNVAEKGRRGRRHLQFMQGCANAYSFQECQSSDAERMAMNLRQPPALQNYTSAGFAKVPAPQGVFSMLQNFYKKHSSRRVRENWPPGNIYTNHWASTVKLLPVGGLPQTEGEADAQPSLSSQQRREIISQVQSVLEAWCKMPLIPTSLYGIRTYKRGSILVPHVDRLPLVLSAIINVAQTVEEDWPLEVIGHDGKAVNVTMEPGEMILYEGASVIHGRPYPLNGLSYSNVFLHFEPVGFSERHYNSADQKRLRKDPKALFEEALAKQQNAGTIQLREDKKDQLPYYVPLKNEDQWQQKYVYMKKTTNKAKKKDSKKTKSVEWDKEVDERLFHNLAAKGMLMKMKEMVMEDPTVITKTDSNGWLALHEAARAGQTHVVEYLCALMDQTEINTRTNGGKGATPTWWAMHMFNDDHPTVKLLIKNGGKSIAPNSSSKKK